jgi:hypothetical protein
MRTSSAGFGPERHFAPVIINGDCRGHILRSAKGFRTFDRDDREIGTYPTPDAAVAALLERAARLRRNAASPRVTKRISWEAAAFGKRR